MVNILVFSWRDPKHPLAGGAEQVMHEHMKGWVEAGHKVTLFASKIKYLPETQNLDGIKIIRRGYQYLGVQIAGFLFYIKNRNKYDLVVDQFHGIPFFTPLYVAKPKLAVIQETARRVWFLNPLPVPLNWIVGLLGYAIEPFVFLFYRNIAFMTGSESAKRDLIKYGIPAKNITIIPHGVLLPKRRFTAHGSRLTTITYLGVLSKDKGIEDALRCFAILAKKGKYKFWVIGKSESEGYFNRLKRLVEHLKLGNKVKFWGFVDQKKKFELLSKSTVLINPSVHEGWGLVNIEANSVGTPVVSYRSTGLVDSVKDGISGIIVDKNTPDELASSVSKLLSDKMRYKKLQKSAVLWSKKFDWEKSRKLSLELIESLSGLIYLK